MLSPGDGLKWNERNKVIGKTVNENISKNEVIYLKNLKGMKRKQIFWNSILFHFIKLIINQLSSEFSSPYP